MADRSFPVEQRFQNGRAHSCYIIKCRKCDASDFMVRGSSMGHKKAEQHFRRKGWTVGRSPHMDTCQLCSSPSKRVVEKPKLTIVPKVESPMEIKAEKPREMSREDRRRVHEKIAEHYLDSGYNPPWTDKRIAEALKVPASWIVEIRDMFFGPEGSNPLYDKFESEAAAFTDAFRELRVVIDQVNALETMGREIKVMLDQIRRETRKAG